MVCESVYSPNEQKIFGEAFMMQGMFQLFVAGAIWGFDSWFFSIPCSGTLITWLLLFGVGQFVSGIHETYRFNKRREEEGEEA